MVQASALITEICSNLSAAAKTVDNTEYTVVLRGDSTLRGHFPEARELVIYGRLLFDFYIFKLLMPLFF